MCYYTYLTYKKYCFRLSRRTSMAAWDWTLPIRGCTLQPDHRHLDIPASHDQDDLEFYSSVYTWGHNVCDTCSGVWLLTTKTITVTRSKVKCQHCEIQVNISSTIKTIGQLCNHRIVMVNPMTTTLRNQKLLFCPILINTLLLFSYMLWPDAICQCVPVLVLVSWLLSL